jgi:AcrR family transcriptional regulator
MRVLSFRTPRSRRTQIIGAARSLFAARGFDGTSLSDLADAVGLKKPALFHHFLNKEEIYGAVVDQLLADVSEGLRVAFEKQGTFDERLIHFSDALVMTLYAHPDVRRLFGRALLECPPRGPDLRVRVAFEGLVAQFRELALCGVAEGRLSPETDPGQACLSALAIHFLDAVPGVRFATSRATAVREQTCLVLGITEAKGVEP